MKKTKKRTCVICKNTYTPSAPNQKYCDLPCREVANVILSTSRDIMRDATLKYRRLRKLLNL